MKLLTLVLVVTISLLIPFYRAFNQIKDAEQVFKLVSDNIILIQSVDSKGSIIGFGSGVIIDKSGIVVTNYHIFDDNSALYLPTFDIIVTTANFFVYDIYKDYLVFKIRTYTKSGLSIANSDDLQIGQKIFAIGNPLGLEKTISEGIISGIRNFEGRNLLQFTASISPGSSGGAIFDTYGRLVGITTGTLRDGQNLNFAIPINDIIRSIVIANNYEIEIDDNPITKEDDVLNKDNDRNEVKTDDGNDYYVFEDAIKEGKLAFSQKKWKKAVKLLTMGLKIDNSDAEIWFMLGYSQTELGNVDKAENAFKHTMSLTSDYNNLIKNYWIDKYNAGITEFNSGIKALGKKNTNDAKDYFKNAIKYLTAATGIIPDSVSAFQLMADSYNYMGETDKALDIYLSILKKSKSKDDAIQIGKLMYQNGLKLRQDEDYASALTIFQKIITIPYLPKNNIYYESSLFNCGFANYQMAVKKATDNKPKSEYEPLLKECVKYMEQLSSKSKNKDLLKDTYEILINSYDALGDKAKADDAQQKKNAL